MSHEADADLPPLQDLFRGGQASTSIDTKDERQLGLLMAFEQAIATFDHATHRLTDGAVRLALEALAVKPGPSLGGTRSWPPSSSSITGSSSTTRFIATR